MHNQPLVGRSIVVHTARAMEACTAPQAMAQEVVVATAAAATDKAQAMGGMKKVSTIAAAR